MNSERTMNAKRTEARLGIIGCGYWGALHAAALAGVRGARLVGFSNRTLEKAEALRLKFNGQIATSDPRELLESNEIDGVVIATQHDSHAELCLQAARSGKHVLVEKPIAMTLAQCAWLAEEIGDCAHLIAVGYKLRWAPTIRRARDLLPLPRLIIGQMTEDKWASDSWQQDPRKGGGSVLGNGCHTLDMICYLAGSHPVRVYAEGGTLSHAGHPCLDHMVGTIVFENGALGSWIQGQSGTPKRASKYQFSIFGGDNVAIEVHNRVMTGVYRVAGRTEEMNYSGDEALFQQARGFVAQICDDQPPLCGFWEGLLPNLLLDACARARSTGYAQHIQWNGDVPLISARSQAQGTLA